MRFDRGKTGACDRSGPRGGSRPDSGDPETWISEASRRGGLLLPDREAHHMEGKRPFVLRMLVVVQDLLLVQVGGRGHQAKTSCTFLMPAARTSTSSRSLYT